MLPASLDQLIAAGPRWQRPALRMLFELGLRPRGRALLSLMRPADQAAAALIAMARYDEPDRAGPLGWNAGAVVERGRALRRAEGRP